MAEDRGLLLHHPVGTVTNVLARVLRLSAEEHTFSTACSSSANAIGFGAATVAAQGGWALVGGVDSLSRLTYAGFHSLRLLSSTPCRPFDRDRRGLSLGEGAAFLLLESEERARQGGIPILGYVAGWGCASDAHHPTAPHPRGDGAVAAMEGALTDAGLRPSDVDYVNAHGTATPGNDTMEGLALERVFGRSGPLVSSTKGLTGHTLGAAGAIEAVLSLLTLSSAFVPATVGLEEPDPGDPRPSRAPAGPLRAAVGGGLELIRIRREQHQPRAHRGLGVTPTVRGLGMVGAPVADPDPRVARLPRLERLVFGAVREALGGQPPPRSLGLVFGTGYGGLSSTEAFLQSVLTRGMGYGSATAFHQSVHHSSAGQLSLVLGIRGPVLTVSQRELSGESALRVAVSLMDRVEHVLVVAGDEATPVLEAGYRAFGSCLHPGLGSRSGPARPGSRPAEGRALRAVLASQDRSGVSPPRRHCFPGSPPPLPRGRLSGLSPSLHPRPRSSAPSETPLARTCASWRINPERLGSGFTLRRAWVASCSRRSTSSASPLPRLASSTGWRSAVGSRSRSCDMTPEALVATGAAGLLGTALGVGTWGFLHPRSSFFGPVVWRGPGTRPEVALTFDDGPHPAYTAQIAADPRQGTGQGDLLLHRATARAPGRPGHGSAPRGARPGEPQPSPTGLDATSSTLDASAETCSSARRRSPPSPHGRRATTVLRWGSGIRSSTARPGPSGWKSSPGPTPRAMVSFPSTQGEPGGWATAPGRGASSPCMTVHPRSARASANRPSAAFPSCLRRLSDRGLRLVTLRELLSPA